MKTHRFIRLLTQIFPWLLVGSLGLAGIASAASDPGADLKRSLGSIFEKALTGAANRVAPPGPDLPASGNSGGLTAEYFDNQDLRGPAKITRIDPVINFDWGYGSPGPGVPDDHFGARWSGQIQPRFSESYIFTGNRDNGFRLWIDGQLIVDLWNNEWGGYTSRPIALQAGRRHAIKIEYYEDYGGTGVSLKWRSASQPEELVPSSCLYPAARETVLPPAGEGTLDRTVWFATRGSWNDYFGDSKPYDASGIVVAGGEITLQADRTDQVGVLYRKPISVPAGNIVIIRRRVFVHAASRKFEAGLTAFGVDDEGLSARKPAISDCLFNVGYRNFDYETDHNLFTLTDGRIYPPGPGKFAGGTAPTTPPLWDQWFDEEIRYNPRTGETSCLLNGQERLRLRARPLRQRYLKLMLHPYGWGTGHFVRMQDFRIAVEPASPSDLTFPPPTNPGGTTVIQGKSDRDRLLATPYQWVDNGNLLGTIVFAADGSGRATWSGDTHYWKLESPDQLVISANGTTYVTRLTYQPSDGSFSGARDRTSQVQDGTRTVLRPTSSPPLPGGESGTGLRGEYFDNPDLRGTPKLTRVDQGISADWGDESPGPGMPADNFSIRWTGEIQPRFSESYVFKGNRDDGVRVWIDDRLIIDEWKDGDWAPFASAPVALSGGRRHKIRVEYQEQRGKARIELRWQSPSQKEERIPATCLYPANAGQEGKPNRPLDPNPEAKPPSVITTATDTPLPKLLSEFIRLMLSGRESQALTMTTLGFRTSAPAEMQGLRQLIKTVAATDLTKIDATTVSPNVTHLFVSLRDKDGKQALLIAEFVDRQLNQFQWRACR